MDCRYDLTDDDGEVRELTADEVVRVTPFKDLAVNEQFNFRSPVRVHPDGMSPYWYVKETGLRYADEDTPADNTPAHGRDMLSFAEMPEQYQAAARAQKAGSVSVRQNIALLPEVVEPFRARGEGWERVVEGVLRDWLRDHAA